MAIFYYVDVYQQKRKKKVDIDKMEDYSGACSSIGIREFKKLYQEVKSQLDLMFKEHHEKFMEK